MFPVTIPECQHSLTPILVWPSTPILVWPFTVLFRFTGKDEFRTTCIPKFLLCCPVQFVAILPQYYSSKQSLVYLPHVHQLGRPKILTVPASRSCFSWAKKKRRKSWSPFQRQELAVFSQILLSYGMWFNAKCGEISCRGLSLNYLKNISQIWRSSVDIVFYNKLPWFVSELQEKDYKHITSTDLIVTSEG